ncbi:MAG: hypothetical protein WCT15_00850 [Candidatus Omnitrophota bacterium]
MRTYAVSGIARYTRAFIAVAAIAALAGCAGIEAPTPDDMIRQPLGKSSLKVGMSKQQVESLWGKPDEVRMVDDKEKWQGSREMWVYYAQYGVVPVDVDYLSKTKRLYFDGDNLTNIGG